MKRNILRLLFVFPLLFACGNSTNSEKKTAIDALKEKITAKEIRSLHCKMQRKKFRQLSVMN